MSRYVLLDETKTEVIIGPVELPNTWFNGTEYVTLTGLTDEELRGHNWYPYSAINEQYNHLFQDRIGPEIVVGETAVQGIYTVSYNGLDDIKRQKWNEINNLREILADGGFVFMGYHFDSDQRARENITGTATAIANGLTLPSNFTWRTADNINVPFSAQLVVYLGQYLMGFVSRTYQVSWYHKAVIDSMTDGAAIAAYDFSVGWV